MSGNGCVGIVCDGMSVRIHALSKCLFSLTNVLFMTLETCDQVNNFGRATGNRMSDIVDSISRGRLESVGGSSM
jgi:hypothetical protein